MGLVDIIFTKPLFELPPEIDLQTLEYEAEKNVYKPSLTLEIEPSSLQEPSNVLFTWKILSFTPEEMKI